MWAWDLMAKNDPLRSCAAQAIDQADSRSSRRSRVDRNGLAFEHGFKIGDIILDVGGKKVITPVDVRNAVMDAHKDGKRVVLMRLKSDETTKFVAVPIARV